MKTYTFYPKHTTFRSKSHNNTNYSEIISNTIAANIIKKNPYLAGKTINAEYAPATKRTIDIDITIPAARNSKSIIITTEPAKTRTDFSELAEAINFLRNYKFEKDDYDFKLPDGTPVKLFADEIQIGYDILPLNDLTKAIYDSLSEDSKKNIIDIYITLKK